jgi:hypothetical protein
MPLSSSRLTLCVCSALAITACGGSSSPSAPSPSPTPIAPTLSFVPNAAPGPNSFYLFDARENTSGQIALNVIANGFVVRGGFNKFRGTVLYDSRMLQFVSWTEGPFMKQDNTLAQFAVYDLGSRGVSISVDRATSERFAALGTGTVVVLRFKPARGVTAGSTPMQWTDAHAYFNSEEQLYDTYGGTVTIR